MGLLKDIYDIISSQPEPKRLLEKAVADFLKGGFFRSEPTRQERKDKLTPLIAQLTDDTFSSKFESQLAFLGALTGMVVECTYTAGRGCIIEKLYLPGHIFYFPSIAKEPSLKAFSIDKGQENFYSMTYEDKTEYVFYALELSESEQSSAVAIKTKLSELAQSNPINGECQSLLEWLGSTGTETIPVLGISQHTTTGAFRYLPTTRSILGQSLQLPLNFSDKSTKASLEVALNNLLSSSVI